MCCTSATFSEEIRSDQQGQPELLGDEVKVDGVSWKEKAPGCVSFDVAKNSSVGNLWFTDSPADGRWLDLAARCGL